MRRISFAFAAVFTLVFAAAAGGFHLLHVVQYGRIAASLRWQAEHARDDGRTDEAIRYAFQYLEFRPEDVEMMTGLAEWLTDRAKESGNWKHYPAVLNLYEKALRLTPDDRATRRKAADLGIRLWRWTEAINHLDILLRGEEGGDLFERYAYCQVMVGKLGEAADWYQKAIRADPKCVTAYLGYAGLLWRSATPRPDEALRVVEQAVQANPDSPEALTGLAQYLRARGKLAEAADAIRQARALAQNDKDSAGVLMVAADIEQANMNYEKARALLEEGCARFPQDSRFVCSLAWLLLYEGRTDLALAKLRAGQAANSKDLDILTLLGDLLAQDGQVGPLEETLQELTERGAPPDRIHYVQARLQMRRGRYADAAALLEKLRTAAVRSPSLYRQANHLLAQCCEQLNNATGELTAFQRILDTDPNAGAIRLEFVRALARHGRFDDAVTQFLTMVQRPEVSSRAIVTTARALIDRAERDPNAWAALAKKIDALTIDNVNPNTALTRAALDLARHRPADSLPAVERLVKAQPRNVALHTTRAALTEQVLGLERALGVLAEAEALIYDHAELRAARARMLGARLDRSYGDALARLARGLERYGAVDRLHVLEEVIAASRGPGDSAGVTAYLELLAQLRPDYLPAREALYLIALRANDEPRCQAVLREIEAVEGKDGSTAHVVGAVRLLWLAAPGDAAALAQATARLDAAAQLRPGDPVIEFLYGRVAELAGHADDALRRYQTAFDRGFADRPVEELIATLPGRTGSAPVAVLRDRLPLTDRVRPDRHRTLILAALALYDAAGRTALAGRLAAAGPADDAVQQVWLGRLFAQQGLAAQAEEAFRRASAAAPMSPEGWQALMAYRAARQDADGMRTVAAELHDKLKPVDARLVIGRALESARQLDEARREYESAHSINPNDTRPLKLLASLALYEDRPDQARRWLELMTNLANPSIPDDARWARRTLAVQLAMTPSLDAFTKALEVLKGNEIDGRLMEEDQRARVLALAAQKNRPLPGGGTARRQAIHTLEELREKASGRVADDLILLAQLYRAENDDIKARAAREMIRVEYPGHFGCTAFLAREALRDGDLPACEKLLPVLRRVGAGQFEALAIEFQYRVLAGDHNLGCRLLVDHVAAADAEAVRTYRALRSANLVFDFLQAHPLKNRPEVAADLRTTALRLYRLPKLTDAQTFQRLMPPERAQFVQAYQRLVTLLAEQRPNGTNEALDLIYKGKALFGPEASAAAFVQVYRLGSLSEKQIENIEVFLRDEARKAPQSAALQLSLADFHGLRGNDAEAVALYRDVLGRDRDNIVALNNLAWTLSRDQKDKAKVKESLDHIQRAIDLAGPLDELLHTRAFILFESGQREDGLRDLCEAVKEAPSASRWWDYATLLRRAGQIAAAEKAMAEVRRLGLSDAPTPR